MECNSKPTKAHNNLFHESGGYLNDTIPSLEFHTY